MPARAEEVENAEEEGIVFKILTRTPSRFIGDENGWVKAMELPRRWSSASPTRAAGGGPSRSPAVEHLLDVDVVIAAIGQSPNPLLTGATPDLKLTKWGNDRRGRGDGQDVASGACSRAATS